MGCGAAVGELVVAHVQKHVAHARIRSAHLLLARAMRPRCCAARPAGCEARTRPRRTGCLRRRTRAGSSGRHSAWRGPRQLRPSIPSSSSLAPATRAPLRRAMPPRRPRRHRRGCRAHERGSAPQCPCRLPKSTPPPACRASPKRPKIFALTDSAGGFDTSTMTSVPSSAASALMPESIMMPPTASLRSRPPVPMAWDTPPPMRSICTMTSCSPVPDAATSPMRPGAHLVGEAQSHAVDGRSAAVRPHHEQPVRKPHAPSSAVRPRCSRCR